MPQSIAEQFQSIPMSPSLSQSLGRAQDFAREQSHRALMLEHLLLALTEDPDASGVLRACNVDIDKLGADVSGYLGGLLEDMRAPPGTEPGADAELLRVVEAARQAAQQSRRRAIDGAIVLAAIVGDAKSPAAGLLKAHGMTFEEAIRTLQKASAQARSKQFAASPRPAGERGAAEPAEKAPEQAPGPAPARTSVAAADPPAASGGSVDDILAAARARIQQRNVTTAASNKPEPKPAAKPEPDEPETLPLMSLSSFTPPAVPLPPDLPPMLGAPHGQPAPAGPAPGAPASSQGPPRPPSPAQQPAPGPQGPILPLQALVGTGEAPQRPPQAPAAPSAPPAGPGAPPPQRLMERMQRPERPDGAHAPPRRPSAANGALHGQRRLPAEPARPAARPTAPARGGQRAPAGPLIEAIPRRMRVGAATAAQVRIGRDKVDSLMQLLAGNRAQVHPESIAARVLSVRLRAPDGGFAIEAATPETQWIGAGAGQPQDEPVTWHWDITPLRRGRERLQLLVSARTVGRDGTSAETAPPDRTIEVAVGGGTVRRVVRWVFVLALFAAGIGLGRLSQDRLAQDLLDFAGSLAKHALGLLRTSGFLGG
jgi:hypothetical protein